MTVRLVHSTQAGDDLIAYMARVSNPKNQKVPETAPRLIKYLMKHKHWSPFEMVSMCVEIETTRAISAQILRHRSFSFQEFSQRYADSSKLGIDRTHLRSQDNRNRQNSYDDVAPSTQKEYQRRIQALNQEAMELYEEMLSVGIAKECARGVLPLNTKTRLYMHGTVRSWLHYCDLRMAHGTQREHQEIAMQCWDLLAGCFPAVVKAYEPDL